MNEICKNYNIVFSKLGQRTVGWIPLIDYGVCFSNSFYEISVFEKAESGYALDFKR